MVPSQLAVPVFVLQEAPQAPQLEVDVSDDSQPLVLWFEVSQSAQPDLHPVYRQLPPEQLAPLLLLVSQLRPQAPQFDAVVMLVSQPFVSGGVLLQSAKPDLQLEYKQTAPLEVSQVSKLLWIVSHDWPQAAQEAAAVSEVSQPLVSGGVVSQSAYPGLQPP